MTDALDDISYLARSENRIAVLRELTTEELQRDELRERTGIPRQTMARVLDEFESRGWVETGRPLRATPLAGYILEQFDHLHDRITAANEVADALAYLPTDAAALGVEAFLGSEIVRAGPGDPLSPVRRAIAGLQSVDELRILAGSVTAETLRASLNAVESRNQRLEIVFAPHVVAAIRADETLSDLAARLGNRGGVTLYAGTDDVNYSFGVGGDRVEFGLADDRGAPVVYLATTSEPVVAWASDRLADAIEAASPLSLDDGH